MILKNCYIKKVKNINNNISYNLSYKSNIKNIKLYIINKNINLFKLREYLYELLIYNYDIYDCFTYLFELLIQDKYINDDNFQKIFTKYYNIIQKYNNNYRAIYHLNILLYF